MSGRLRNTLLALVLALGALALALEAAARAQARRIAEALSPVATLDYASAGIAWNGSLRLSAPRLVFHQGPWPGDARARVAYFSSGGLFWTLARSLLGTDGLPVQGHVEIHGLGVSHVPGYAVIAEWLQPPGMVLFEMQGCEGHALTEADRQRMQVRTGERIDRIDYRSDAATQRFELAFTFEQPALARLKGSAEFTGFKPLLWNDVRARSSLRLAHAELAYDDPGYLARRNAFCAQRSGISSAQFIERHIVSVDNTLARLGITPSESVRKAYRDLVGTGGTLNLTTLPDSDWEPAEFAAYSRSDLLRQLNITARHNDAPPVMLQLAFSEPTVPLGAPAPAAHDTAATARLHEQLPRAEVVDPLPAIVTQAVAATVVAAAPPVVDGPLSALPAESHSTARIAPADAPAPTTLGASAPPPPKDSTLALVWKPGVIERLAPREAPARDYEVVATASLGTYAGRRVRLLTLGGKLIDGELRRIDSGQAVVRVRSASGNAEISVPLANVREVRLVVASAR